jgi:hypothetical protein
MFTLVRGGDWATLRRRRVIRLHPMPAFAPRCVAMPVPEADGRIAPTQNLSAMTAARLAAEHSSLAGVQALQTS